MVESKGNAAGQIQVITLRGFYFNRDLVEAGKLVTLPKIFALEMVENGNARLPAPGELVPDAPQGPTVPPAPAGEGGDPAGDDPASDDDDDPAGDDEDLDDEGDGDVTGPDGAGDFGGNPLISRRARGRPRKGS